MGAQVLIHGTGGMGRETADWALDCGLDVVGFLDDDSSRHGAEIAGLPVLGDGAVLVQHPDASAAIAVGAPVVRARLSTVYADRAATIVHPSAEVGRRTGLHIGVLIGPNVVVTTDCELHGGVIVNYGAVIGHDCVLGPASFVGPGVSIAGEVTVGDRAWVGIGASVLQGVNIGADAVIGAGAVVINDVPAGATVVGVPARPMGR